MFRKFGAAAVTFYHSWPSESCRAKSAKSDRRAVALNPLNPAPLWVAAVAALSFGGGSLSQICLSLSLNHTRWFQFAWWVFRVVAGSMTALLVSLMLPALLQTRFISSARRAVHPVACAATAAPAAAHPVLGPLCNAAEVACVASTGKGMESSGSGRAEWGTWWWRCGSNPRLHQRTVALHCVPRIAHHGPLISGPSWIPNDAATRNSSPPCARRSTAWPYSLRTGRRGRHCGTPLAERLRRARFAWQVARRWR